MMIIVFIVKVIIQSIVVQKSLAPAFVLKNFIKSKNSVIIFHKHLGKITCIYFQKDISARLCSGSYIFCSIEKKHNYYVFTHVDIIFTPLYDNVEQLTFIHNLVKLCLFFLPKSIAVYELFDFLQYIYQRLDNLTEDGQNIVLLRLFLMFDLLPEDRQIYRCAQQDPYQDSLMYIKESYLYVQTCWNIFSHEIQRKKVYF